MNTPRSAMIGGAGIWTPGATIIGAPGVKKTLNQLIKSLFSNGEQGFFYDTNDLSTMYQNAAGTIPVTTAGQPVELRKDKSGRNNHAFQTVSASRPILQQTPILGNELVVNGGFSGGVTGWGAVDGTTEVILNGYLKFNNALTANPNVIQYNVIRPAKTYAVSFKVANRTAGGVFLVLYGDSWRSTVLTPIAQANGVFSTIISSHVGATGTIGIRTQDNTTLDITNVSIREVTGYQTDQNYLKFDGVDDKLTTTLPTQLTGCTVIRSVPNVGTQILTGQTIPATYEDNTDHCGLLVINRALTASETSQITSLFNKAAGV